MVLKRASMIWILVASAAVAVLIIGTAMVFAPGEDGEVGFQGAGMVWGLVVLLAVFAAFVLLVFKMVPHGHEDETDHLKRGSVREKSGGSTRQTHNERGTRTQDRSRGR